MTIQHWFEERTQAKRARTYRVAGLSVALIAAYCIYDTVAQYRSRKPPTSTFMMIQTPARNQKDALGDRPATHYEQRVLTAALSEWNKKIGKLWIARPKLIHSSNYCGSLFMDNIAACSGSDENQIALVDSLGVDQTSHADLKTVLMHEVGHLLGVPHIEDDDLMNSRYIRAVDVPTPSAVALALLNVPHRALQGSTAP